MREIDNKNIQVTWIPLIWSTGLVEMAVMTVMAVMISPVKEIATLLPPNLWNPPRIHTMLRRAQKWPRLN
jgi:hypothetical protein